MLPLLPERKNYFITVYLFRDSFQFQFQSQWTFLVNPKANFKSKKMSITSQELPVSIRNILKCGKIF